MKNDAISSLKNHFPHPGKMVCHVSKLAQFGPNLKLWRICQNCESPVISRGSAQFRAKFQFWSFSFVPNCPNWPQCLVFKGLTSLEVFRQKNPLPTGESAPVGQLSLVEGFAGAHFIFLNYQFSNHQTGGL